MKKMISCVLFSVMCCGILTSCTPKGTVKVREYEFSPIAYTESEFDKGTARDNVVLSVPARTVKTGQEISAGVKITARKAFAEDKDKVYFIVDWGDGTWSYLGPGIHNTSKQSKLSLPHTYKKAGTYRVTATAKSMQTDEELSWCAPKTVRVEGEDFEPDNVIKAVRPISSQPYDGKCKAENITDGKPTYFKSRPAEDVDDEIYAGYLFDEIYTLDRMEVKIPADSEVFPSNIAVEYTSDSGETWQSLPKYYYLYDYSAGRFNPIMRFPNPKGATLVLNLDGIVANGIRFVSKLSSLNLSDLDREKCLLVEEMRVYGSLRTLLYTSMGDTFDADLNNMWTIFGTAKTEPIVSGSIRGESTNQSPFRTGSAMIGSTEWAEWNGLKFNFTDYDFAKEEYLDLLVRMRYGPDGWSNDDGYIWATADAPGHLDMGCHYSLNPIFIMAVRNYLLQGNALGRLDENDNYVDFMNLTNGQNQTMQMKIDKAMSYMMNTLDGKNGIMTIFDPTKDGTTNANAAANYWDVHKSFGYKSAYENALFYGSLVAYADIAEYQGKTELAEEYRAHAAKTKELYNALFWDDRKGRFIGSVNRDGVRLDFGFTFVNFMAVAYGVAEDDKIASVYDWVDGNRIVEGDTSTGGDIYGRFKYAARSTTLDVSSTGKPYYWYDHGGALSPEPGAFGGFGNQMQNGGTIFYISYYDLMGRIDRLSADNGFARFSVIMDEFHKDSLRRNGYSEHGEYIEGVIGEFPESGLVPYTFVSGFLGLKTTAEGLRISPKLPTEMDYAGISTYVYGNRTYSIQVSREVDSPKIEKYGDTYFLRLPADQSFLVTPDNRLIAL